MTGSPYFDSTNVRQVDSRTVEIVNKKDGKVTGTSKMIASEDGKTLTTEWSFVAVSGQQGNGMFRSRRLAAGPEDAHLISGSWQPSKIESASENVMELTYKMTADGLSMSDQIGDSFTAKFDGKDYPFKGDPGITTVSLAKIDANTIVETDKREGKVITVTKLKVAPDGKTMTLHVEDKLRDVSVKWTATKQ